MAAVIHGPTLGRSSPAINGIFGNDGRHERGCQSYEKFVFQRRDKNMLLSMPFTSPRKLCPDIADAPRVVAPMDRSTIQILKRPVNMGNLPVAPRPDSFGR